MKKLTDDLSDKVVATTLSEYQKHLEVSLLRSDSLLRRIFVNSTFSHVGDVFFGMRDGEQFARHWSQWRRSSRIDRVRLDNMKQLCRACERSVQSTTKMVLRDMKAAFLKEAVAEAIRLKVTGDTVERFAKSQQVNLAVTSKRVAQSTEEAMAKLGLQTIGVPGFAGLLLLNSGRIGFASLLPRFTQIRISRDGRKVCDELVTAAFGAFFIGNSNNLAYVNEAIP